MISIVYKIEIRNLFRKLVILIGKELKWHQFYTEAKVIKMSKKKFQMFKNNFMFFLQNLKITFWCYKHILYF